MTYFIRDALHEAIGKYGLPGDHYDGCIEDFVDYYANEHPEFQEEIKKYINEVVLKWYKDFKIKK